MPIDKGRDLREHASRAPRYNKDLESTSIQQMHKKLLAEQATGKANPKGIQESGLKEVPRGTYHHMHVENGLWRDSKTKNVNRIVIHIITTRMNPAQFTELLKRHFAHALHTPDVSYEDGVDFATGTTSRMKGSHCLVWQGKMIPDYVVSWIREQMKKLDAILSR